MDVAGTSPARLLLVCPRETPLLGMNRARGAAAGAPLLDMWPRSGACEGSRGGIMRGRVRAAAMPGAGLKPLRTAKQTDRLASQLATDATPLLLLMTEHEIAAQEAQVKGLIAVPVSH